MDNRADYTDMIRGETHEVDVETFKKQGVKKLNVINASKINELITKAVNTAIAKLEKSSVAGLKDDKAQLIADSVKEFKNLVKGQKDTKKKEQKVEINSEIRQELVLLRSDMAELKNLLSKRKSEEGGDTVKVVKQTLKAMMQELERSGLIKGVSEIADEAGEAIAGAVIEKIFKEETEAHMTMPKVESKKTTGKNILSSLQKSKQMKGKD